jgi:threonine aldolase
MPLDFRSDTLTQPTPAMREAMMAAAVGDDVYGEDPSVNALEAKAAALFGMEAAMFAPSGTMCNQIAIRLHARPQEEVICERHAHIYLYEGGGIAAQAQASVCLLEGERGRLSARQIEEAIRPEDLHQPRSSLVALENTFNKGGGSCYSMESLEAISALCRARGLALHLDGARLFNALVATGQRAEDYGRLFDTISVCLSKGLGAPVGSLLLGSQAQMKQARRIRKMMGGGMRQAGFLAAAGLYALEHHVERLAEDHARAARLAKGLEALPWVAELLPPETNILVFRPDPARFSAAACLARLRKGGLLASDFGGGWLRLVTHLGHSDEDIEAALGVLRQAGA